MKVMVLWHGEVPKSAEQIDIERRNCIIFSLSVVIVSLININNWPCMRINNFQRIDPIVKKLYKSCFEHSVTTNAPTCINKYHIWRWVCFNLSHPPLCVSYCKIDLSSVTLFVCAPSPGLFMDLRSPSSAGRSGRGTKNTQRKQIFKIL